MIMDIKKLIAPNFYSLHIDIQNRRHSVYRLKGGRGSLKTSTIIVEVLLLMQKHKELCTAVFMKQSNRIRQGAFANYVEMIERAGLSSEYSISISPMRITNKRTGQIIAFFGLDDPNKTKGISTGNPNTYFGITHFEELDQFNGNREIDTAVDSVTRGGDLSWCFQCYNPPQNSNNWVNKDSLINVKGRLVHSSDYRTVPVEWLGEAFINKVRLCYNRNEKEYRWRYLGEVTGIEGQVFGNIEQWQYDPDKQYDFIFQGLDLGWQDPKAFVRIGYIIDTRELYILDEFYKSKAPNSEVANFIYERGYTDAITIIESAGGSEAMQAYTERGIPMQVVNKGNHLKMNGIEFLSSRQGIFIDPDRTPNAWEEFSLYEWKKDKNGEVISPACPIDGNDHTIDATRYAISQHIGVLGG